MGSDLGSASLISSVEHLFRGYFSVVSDIFKLFTLEVKQAGRSLVMILILVLTAIILLLSSWLALMVAGIMWLMSMQVSLAGSLAIFIGFNLIIAAVIGFFILRLSNHLSFKETRKQLDLTTRDDNEPNNSKN